MLYVAAQNYYRFINHRKLLTTGLTADDYHSPNFPRLVVHPHFK